MCEEPVKKKTDERGNALAYVTANSSTKDKVISYYALPRTLAI
jgi:hypothetical protein